MKETMTLRLEGHVVEEDMQLSLLELCRACGASEHDLQVWVSEGVLEPQGQQPQEWRFAGASLRRARTASRLARDLEINAAGLALALDLLEEIDALKARLARFPSRRT